MATLTVSATTNFSATALTNITLIDFTNTGAAATATFSATQFDNVAIKNNVAIDGTAQANNFTINLASGDNSLDASGWTFTNWTASADTITINGFGSAFNTIVGSSQRDVINGASGNDTFTGGLGADAIAGGNGNDTFVYNAPAEIAAGETIAGDIGVDKILLNTAGDYDFTGIAITTVENLTFSAAGGSASLDAADISSSAINSVTGGAGLDTISVTGLAINLTGVTFSSWSTTDVINLNAGISTSNITGSNLADNILGSTVGDTLNGADGDDTITGGRGSDTLSGGNGNDTFVYNAANELTATEVVDGGPGTDHILINNGISYNFSSTSITNVERLDFGSGSNTAIFNALQTGNVAGLISGFNGSAGTDTLTINLPAVAAPINLAGTSFTNWTAGTDIINLNGGAGNDTITGSLQGDRITGGAGADTLVGGGGNDTFLINAASELVAGETISDTTQINVQENRITLSGSGTFDFTGVTITGVRVLDFSSAGSTVNFAAAQVGGNITTFQILNGSAAVDNLVVNGNASLVSATFNTWTDGIDTITLNGTSGNDSLIGSIFADTLNGGSGDDILTGQSGDDLLNGGGGNDGFSGGAGNDTMNGGGQIDTMSGHTGNDIMLGFAGNDSLQGGDDDDFLDGGAGADGLFGDNGNDTFRFALGSDTAAGEQINGGDGTDRILITGSGTFDFSTSSIAQTERLEFSGGAATAIVLGSDMNAIAGDIDFIQGNGAVNNLVVTGGSANLSIVSFQNWTDGTDTITINGTAASNEFFLGTAQRDAINAGDGNDSLTGGLGLDIVHGDGGNDSINYNAANELVAGEIIDGGAGSDDQLFFTGGTFNFATATITGIERLQFGNSLTTGVFNGASFGSSGITTISGFATSNLFINGSVDLSAVNVGFGAGSTITITGTNSADTIIGSAILNYSDTINGGDGDDDITGGHGADILGGGTGNDTFRYNGLTDNSLGDIIDGGVGSNDRIVINAGGEFFFSNMTNVERIEFSNSAGRIVLIDPVFGAGGITSVAGGSANDTLSTSGAVNLSNVTFSNWTNGVDRIDLSGGSADDIIVGSSLADLISGIAGNDSMTGGGGADTMNGGAGNDSFIFLAGTDIVAGEEINGGNSADTDRILINGGGIFDFTPATISFVDQLSFSATPATAIVSSNQLGTIFDRINTINGSTGADALTIKSVSAVTMVSDLTFLNWTDGVDTITISGLATGDSIEGSARAEILLGNDGADILTGNGGADQLFGGAGNDVLFFDAADTINGGTGIDEGNFVGVTSGLRTFNFVATEMEKIFWTYNGNNYTLTAGSGGTKVEDVEDNANTESFRHLTTTLDSLSRIELEDKLLDGGAGRIVTDFDAGNIAAFNQIIQTFTGNQANLLDVDDRRFDNGTRVVIDFDPLLTQAFSSVATSYTAGGLVDFQDTQNDDGTRFIFDFDQDNAFGFNTVQSSFAPGNILDVQDTLNDDGRRVVFDRDVPNAFAFSTVTTTYVPGGAVDFQDTFFDDGRRVIFDGDQDNAFIFTSVTTSFDATGARDVEDTTFDDAHRVVFDYDNLNNQTFQTFKTVFDTAGAIDFTDVLLDNNFRTVTDLDNLGNQPWLSTKNEFDNTGFLFRQTITLDSGAVQVFNFP